MHAWVACLWLFVSGSCQKQDLPELSPLESYFNEIAREVDLATLRLHEVRQDDLQLRIWVATGQMEETGYFLQKVDGEWSGTKLTREAGKAILKTLSPSKEAIAGPSDTWEQIGDQLLRQDILTLPDMQTLPKRSESIAVMDGQSIFVEVKTAKEYRHYHYQFNAAKQRFDFEDPIVVDAFLSAANIKNILTHSLKATADR
jgi:hypothetical protein